VVAADADGLIGEFILDTGAPRTVIDATQASEAGLDKPTRIPVRLAGRTVMVTADVAPLDARTRDFQTPITGVLGSDVLSGLVVDIDAWPCRVTIGERHRRPRRGAVTLPMTLPDGVPEVAGALADGTRSEPALLRIDTGSPRAVTLNAAVARTEPAAPAGAEPRGTLRALALGPFLEQEVDATLASDAAAPAFASLGWPLLARYRIGLDYGRGVLTLTPRRGALPAGFASSASSVKQGAGASPDE
jgi:hypothetical protein